MQPTVALPRNSAHRLAAALTVGVCLAVAGCGGGGGGGTPTPGFVPRTPPTADVLNTPDDAGYTGRRDDADAHPEYAPSFTVPPVSDTYTALRRINAAAAYARGATGDGETILIQDSGVRDTHREFAGAGSVTGVGNKLIFETESGYSPTDDERNHGTMVAAVAAGNRDGGGVTHNMHGVAFDADIYFREIDLSIPIVGEGGYQPHTLGDANEDRALTDQLLSLIGRPDGAIINFSFGADGGIERYDPAAVRAALPMFARTLEQPGVVAADKQIVVWAAGNAYGERVGPDMLRPPGDPDPRELAMANSPELFASLGVAFPALRPHVLAVVALDQDGAIADYSNRCGVARDFCLAAPGSALSAAAGADDDYAADRGTSFAAPLVSGSLAVLRQYFRGQLGNTELVDRLLGTADRRGDYADADIYGHGLVDLDAATRPVMTTADGTIVGLMTGMPGTRGNRPLAGGFAVAGGAFGGALGDALASVSVAGFDALGAPFFVPAAAMVSHARRRDAADTTVDIPLAAAGVTVADSTALITGVTANYDRTVIPAGRRYPVVHGRQSSGEVWSWTANLAGDTLASPTAGGVATGTVAQRTTIPSPRLSLTVGDDGAVTAARVKTAGGWWLGYANDASRELGLSAAAAAPLINESFATPYLSLVRDGPAVGKRGDRLGFALLHGAPRFDDYDADADRGIGVVVDWRVGGHTLIDGGGGVTDFSLQAGIVTEPDGVLGARATDAFGDLAGETAFVGVQGAWVVGGGHGDGGVGGHRHGDTDGWRLAASAFIGNTRADAGGGFVSGVGGVTSDAFAVTAARGGLWRRGDRLGLAVSQPLRVADGDLTLTLPAGRTRYGEVVRRRHRVALAPAGRAVRVGAAYRAPIAAGVVTGTVSVERNPDHDADADDEALVKVSFSKSF